MHSIVQRKSRGQPIFKAWENKFHFLMVPLQSHIAKGTHMGRGKELQQFLQSIYLRAIISSNIALATFLISYPFETLTNEYYFHVL